MSRHILTIDIRNNSIAAVVLNAGLKSHTIESCVYIPLPDGQDRLNTGLSALRDSGLPVNPTVVVSLPADRAKFRTIFVPFKEEKKIRQVLPFELEPNLPVPVDELIIDFQKSADPDKTGVLTTAVDRFYLEQIIEALTAVNLRPQMVVPGGIPLALVLPHYRPLETQALLLDVGPRRTTLVALEDDKIALLRSVASDISSETAVEALALRIRQTLTGFADSHPGGFSPKTVYMTGPAMADEEAGIRLSKALDMELQRVDLRTIAPKVDAASTQQDQWKPFLFDSALALALIEAEGRSCLSFHRSTSSFRKFWTKYRPYLQVPAVLMAIVVLLGLTGVLIESHMVKKRVDEIDASIETLFAATFPQTRRVGIALDQMNSEIKKAKSSTIDSGQPDSRVRTIDILFQLSQLTPKEVDVVFSRLVLGSDGLTISGETAAFNAVDDIKNRLEKSDLFKQVTIASANMDKTGNKVQFILKIDL